MTITINIHGKPAGETWTPRMDSLLRKLREDDKLSFAAVAAAMNQALSPPKPYTKNAVLARYHRKYVDSSQRRPRGSVQPATPVDTLRSENQCRFINDAGVYCPSKATHGSWCEAHGRAMYTAAKRPGW